MIEEDHENDLSHPLAPLSWLSVSKWSFTTPALDFLHIVSRCLIT